MTNTPSAVDLPALNPAWRSLTSLYRMCFTLSRMTAAKSFLRTDRSITGLKLPSSPDFLPGFKRGTKSPKLKSEGTVSDLIMWLKRSVKNVTTGGPPALNISTVTPSCPAARPSFILPRSWRTWSSVTSASMAAAVPSKESGCVGSWNRSR